MKYKISLAIFATLFLFSFPTKISSEQCVDFTRGNQVKALLSSMEPAAWMVNDGKEGASQHIVNAGSSVQLLENVNASIRISADNVTVDLNGFKIKSSDNPVIQIDIGVKNTVVKNGSIEGDGGNAGIAIGKAARAVILENLIISNVDVGMAFNGTEPNPIECCKVTDCLIMDCDVAVVMVAANKCVFEDCQVCECGYFGFLLEACMYNKFIQCKAIKVGPADIAINAAGFASLGGKDNLFYECMAEGVCKTENTSRWCTKAMGFWFGFDSFSLAPETESKIINCFVDSIKAASFSNAFGVNLDVRLLAAAEQVGTADFNLPGNELGPVTSVSWSPQGTHIAVAIPGTGEESFIKVYQFNGSTWGEIYNIPLGPSSAPFVEFSPDGQLLAVTYDGIIKIYRVSDFTELATRSGEFVGAKWFHCGRMLAAAKVSTGTVTDPDLTVLVLEGDKLITIKDVAIPGVNGGYALDISPDDKYIIFADRESPINLHIIEVASWTVAAVLPSAGAAVAVFNPVVCCGKYYFALNSGRFYEFDPASKTISLLSYGMTNVGTPIWFPNGKYVVYKTFADGQNQVFVDEFNPEENPSPVLKLSYSITRDDVVIVIDVSPCGRYVFIAYKEDGEEEDPDILSTEVISVGKTVAQCVVENTRVANVKGGMCGIGIIGGGSCNLIDANLLYGNCINASKGVFNTFCDYRYANTHHKPQPLENLSFSNLACSSQTCCSNTVC